MTYGRTIEEQKQDQRDKRERSRNRAARRPQLGSWHTITERAIKVHEGKQVIWQAEPIKDVDYRYARKLFGDQKTVQQIRSYRAMYIGYRFKFNGEWKTHTSGDWDEIDESYFHQRETVEVWLFVTHDNRNPIPVFPFEVPPVENKDALTARGWDISWFECEEQTE